MKVRYLVACLGVASVVLVGAVGKARADEWFMLAEQTLQSVNPSVEITGEEGKLFKEDIKKTKLSVDGADVEISKVVLHWNNSPDDTIYNLGVVKSGGETAPKDAPGRQRRTSCRWRSSTRSLIMRRRPTSRCGDTTERV